MAAVTWILVFRSGCAQIWAFPFLCAHVLHWSPLSCTSVSRPLPCCLSLCLSLYGSAPLCPRPQAWQLWAAESWVPSETSLWVRVGEPRGHQALLLPLDLGWEPQGQLECRRHLKKGTVPYHPPFPATIFLFFTSSISLPLSCLHSPSTHRLLSCVLSHLSLTHAHTAFPSVPAPSRPQGPPHRAPCFLRLMRARWLPVTQPWPVGTQASYLPMPHTQLLLPQQIEGTCYCPF